MKQTLLPEFIDDNAKSDAKTIAFKNLRQVIPGKTIPEIAQSESARITPAAASMPLTPVTSSAAPLVSTPTSKSLESIPDLLPGLYPLDFHSDTFDAPAIEIDDFDPTQIPFNITGDPNEPLWQEVKEGKVDRNRIFNEYKSLGETVTIEGNRGIPDLARKRALNFQQHFTPPVIAKFIAEALKLDLPGTPAFVVDNSCGIGRMFQFLGEDCGMAGIEVEEKAYQMARTLFSKANIINDDLINHPYVPADYFIINPPFSIQLEKKNCGFENAGWGKLGPGTSIKSHIAAMETAVRNARYYVAAMLPQGYFTNEETLTFERWVNHRAQLIYRLDIDEKAFTEYGFTWPCSVVIYRISNYGNCKPIHSIITSLDEETLAKELKLLQATEEGRRIDEAIESIKEHGTLFPARLTKHKPEPAAEPDTSLSLDGADKVKLCLSPDASQLNLKTDNLLTALKIQELRDGFGESYNRATKNNIPEFKMYSRRYDLIEKTDRIYEIKKKAERLGIETVIDPQILNWLRNKKKWLKRQMTPFEQWVYQGNTEQAMKNLSEGYVLIAVNSINNTTMNVTAGNEYVFRKTYRDALEIKGQSLLPERKEHVP